MKRTYIADIPSQAGSEIIIKGFVQTIRDQGNIKFLIIRDVTGTVQTVVLKKSPSFEESNDLTIESVVKITGLAKEEKQAPSGYEVEAQKIEILSLADPELPIPVVIEKGGEETNVVTRLDYRWIDLRKSK